MQSGPSPAYRLVMAEEHKSMRSPSNAKCGPESQRQPLDILEFAFPDGNHLPALIFEPPPSAAVAQYVFLKFPFPEGYSRLRHIAVSAVRVTVPEAAVHEDHCPVLRQYDVWPSREITSMQTES